jgi:hypothetical protein
MSIVCQTQNKISYYAYLNRLSSYVSWRLLTEDVYTQDVKKAKTRAVPGFGICRSALASTHCVSGVSLSFCELALLACTLEAELLAFFLAGVAAEQIGAL